MMHTPNMTSERTIFFHVVRQVVDTGLVFNLTFKKLLSIHFETASTKTENPVTAYT